MEITKEQKEAIAMFEFCSKYKYTLGEKRTEIILNLIKQLQWYGKRLV